LVFNTAKGASLQLANLDTTDLNATGTLTATNIFSGNVNTGSLISSLANIVNLNATTTDTKNLFADFVQSRQQGLNSQANLSSSQNFLYAGGNFSQNRIISDGASLGNFILGETYINTSGASNTNIGNANISNGNATFTTLFANKFSVASLTVSNVLLSLGNVLTSNIGGSQSSTSIINSNTLSFNENNAIVTTNINGVIATTTIGNLYKYFASSTNLTVATDTFGNVTYSFTDSPVFANATISSATVTNLAVDNFTIDTLQKIATNTTHNINYSTSTKTLTSVVNGKVATTAIIISDLPTIIDGDGINISTTSTTTTISLDLSTFGAGTGTISSTSVFTANVTNLFANALEAINGSIDGLISKNATITNLVFNTISGINATTTNFATTNLTATGTTNLTNLFATNFILSSGTIATVTIPELNGNYATFTKIFTETIQSRDVAYYGIVGNYATFTNATATENLFVNNISGVNASTTYLTWINATGGNATTTNFATGDLLAAGKVRLGETLIFNDLEVSGKVNLATANNVSNYFGRGEFTQNYFGVGNNSTNYFGGDPTGNQADDNFFYGNTNTFLGTVNFSGGFTNNGGMNVEGTVNLGINSSGDVTIGNDANKTEVNSRDIYLGYNADTDNIFVGSTTNSISITGNLLSSSIVLASSSFVNSTNTYATSTNFFTEFLRATNVNLVQATTTYLNVENWLTASNANINNLLFTTVEGRDATITNGTSTNWYSTNFTSPNIFGSLATITNATFTSLRSETFYTNTFGFDNVFAQNATFTAKLSVGGPFVSNNYRVNFVDNVPGTTTGSAAFSMTNLATTATHTNTVLRLNTGAFTGLSGPCDNTGQVKNLTSGNASSTYCAKFLDFYASSTDEISGTEVGYIALANSANSVHRVVYSTAGADFGEELNLYDDPKYGDIVGFTGEGYVLAQPGIRLVGVVSDNAGFIGNINTKKDKNSAVVGYVGIVRTFVSTENGAIKKGDPIGLGSVPGVGIKMTKSGYIIGHARENYTGTEVGKIEVQVDPTWYDPDILQLDNFINTKLSNTVSSTTEIINSGLANKINAIIDSKTSNIIDSALQNPSLKLATSSINTAIDNIFIEYFTATNTTDILSVNFVATNSEGKIEKFNFLEMQVYILENISKFNKFVDNFNENLISVAEVVTDKLTAKEVNTEKLCIGKTCVTEEELKILLNKNSQESSVVVPAVEVPNTTIPTTSVPTTTPPSTSSSTDLLEPVVVPQELPVDVPVENSTSSLESAIN
jgi:hypothetical protein